MFDVGFVACSSLGRGFLTGTAAPAADYPPNDLRAHGTRWQPGNHETNHALLPNGNAIVESTGCTVAQVALGDR